MIANFTELRGAYYRALVRQCFGPLPEDGEPDQYERRSLNPADYYLAGMLFPRQLTHDRAHEMEEETDTPVSLEESDVEDGSFRQLTAEDESNEGPEPEEEPLNLANENFASAMGLTFKVSDQSCLRVTVTYGTYQRKLEPIPHPKAGQKREDGTPFPATYEKKKSYYLRTPHQHTQVINLAALSYQKRIQTWPLDERVLLHLTKRPAEGGNCKASLMLLNSQTAYADKRSPFHQIVFQTSFSVEALDGEWVFLPIEQISANQDDREKASLALLYRDSHAFGLGHGCAVIWKEVDHTRNPPRCGRLITDFLPCYEAKLIGPREAHEPVQSQHSLQMSMAFLCGQTYPDDHQRIIDALKVFSNDYQAWIENQDENLAVLASCFIDAGKRHLRDARECLDRMRGGIELLARDPVVLQAFQLANRAMWVQFYRGHLSHHPKVTKPPKLENYLAEWRPFQLGFLLMNLRAFVDPKHVDRNTVDLIWFPTGGGKTEAYLGLAAYAICLRRLLKPENAGTQVIMRYTLRLLTTQQFQRATALILALEHMRQKRYQGLNLGEKPISVGLWTGNRLTPNRRADALRNLEEFKRKGRKNVFQIMQCPWCGEAWDQPKRPGYDERQVGGHRTVIFRCPNPLCFCAEGAPIKIVDEDLYQEPPTLILGTVDKFAQIAWRDKVANLFGIGTEYDSPQLIIQDELHLISGPLGTMVGLYETAIDRMCGLGGHPPKIVASTATICHAKSQCKALYGDRNIIQFPPQGLQAGDSYFAKEDLGRPGRLYVGVFPSSARSMKAAQKHVVSHLLQNLLSLPQAREYPEFVAVYGTLIWYFNSLRELGLAVSLCQGELTDYLKGLQNESGLPIEERRRVWEFGELTSRRTASEIPQILKQMAMDWKPLDKRKQGKWPIDILLATNMIAVGVDISRLGLMLINGQPKTTAEYIQSSSRVGRDRNAPGMVVTLYNPAKNRDRSHFEQFVHYHQSLYQFVEPTSVTPFSPPARERGLPGVIIGLARLVVGLKEPGKLENHLEEIKNEVRWLLARVKVVDPDEYTHTKRQIDDFLERWIKYSPIKYGPMFGKASSKSLAYPYGQHRHPEFQREAVPVPTSLRNVDGLCHARVLTSTYKKGNQS